MSTKRDSREYYWKRLDNAAKGFSAISDSYNTNVFRLSAKLKHEIDRELLQAALEKTLAEIPSFNVKIHKGFFWYYLESNFAVPKLTEDSTFPCLKIDRFKNNGFLFKVSYYKKRINLEVFHVLTDGGGAVIFLKRLLYNYLSARFPELTLTEVDELGENTRQSEHDEDSFLFNYRHESSKKGHNEGHSYSIKGPYLEKDVTGVITGVMPVKRVLELSRESGATVTEYLTAVLLQSIFLGSNPRFLRDKPIVICIPVNLRGMFNSKTLGNFFSYLNIPFKFDKNYSFEEILESVKQSFKNELKRDKIEERIRYNVEAEQNPVIRFVPLFLKRIGLKVIHHNAEKSQSCSLSNIGIVKLPHDVAELVERFDVLVSASRLKPIKVGVISFGDCLSVTFTSYRVYNDIQQCFFSFLSGKGVPIEIVNNEI